LSTILFYGQQLTGLLRTSNRPREALGVATVCIECTDPWPTSELSTPELDSLSLATMWFGHSLQDLERFVDAHDAYATDLDLRRQLLDREPDSFQMVHRLGISHHNMGANFAKQGNFQAGLDRFLEAERLQREALERNPGSRLALGFLREHISETSLARCSLGEQETAIEMALGLAEIRDGTGEGPLCAAATLGHIVGLLQDAPLDPAKRAELVDRATRECLAFLRQASQLGPEAKIMWNNPGYDSIRGHPEFQKLLLEADDEMP
jgi:tetratricopeptide (TPR) repeat protein